LTSFVVLFSVSGACRTKIVFVDPAIDILGFVKDNRIVGAVSEIKDGVIVTPGFILEYRRLRKALEDCEKGKQP
jgi:hypothetical protein